MTNFIFGLAVTVVIAVTGVSLIAQEAKPGDLLYIFKTAVNERVVGWLATTYMAQVDHEVDVLEERLSEIDALLEEGELTPENAQMARDGVLAQLNKVVSSFDQANGMYLDAAAKARLSASLQRLQVALKNYRDSLNTLDKTLAAKDGTDESLTAPAIADASESLDELAAEVLDEADTADMPTDPATDVATSTATTTEAIDPAETTATSTDQSNDATEEETSDAEAPTTDDAVNTQAGTETDVPDASEVTN